jgi:endonuclease/exonuclease/phosphatase family metal-dependent hydrolase
LHHVVGEELVRLDQAKNMLKWIDLITSQDDINIILGDFNALPYSETYNHFINCGYISSYFHHHFDEPIKTFHSKMDAPFKDTDDEGTFDYIL